ncbi:hypothetical protein FTUN_6201 [Frigoriglobus tundricola]|uniref:Uncharacterized protein n=1 Tax=Frigoriglobus tundricola TaxID=2774151 RepID=A0A6M5YYS8_9BACT|nr:hypothetical protein FTUN_6201 [Frigoriglobus tundricola]
MTGAVAALRAERPGVRAATRSTIDQVLIVPRRAGLHDGLELPLWRAVADGCDDDPFRRAVRAAALPFWWSGGRAGQEAMPELYRLAERAATEDLPGDAVALLADTLGALADKMEVFASYGKATASSEMPLIAVFRAVRDRDPGNARLQSSYGDFMRSLWNETREPRAFAEALGGLRAAIALRPNDSHTFYDLGRLLSQDGDRAGAAAAYRAALARNPRLSFARINLAVALKDLGDLNGAIATLRETVRRDPQFAVAHYYLGLRLEETGDPDGAAAEYKEALRINPRNQNAARGLARVERRRPLLARLPGALAGTDRPAAPTEALDLAALCYQPFQRRYAAAVGLCELAFAADPGGRAAGASARDPKLNTNRYDAACYAALAGGGQGADAPAEPSDRAALREKVRAWLRADLATWQKRAGSSSGDDRREVVFRLTRWLDDSDLKPVREEAQLRALPTDERRAWLALWADVTEALAQARTPPPPPEVAPPPRERK